MSKTNCERELETVQEISYELFKRSFYFRDTGNDYMFKYLQSMSEQLRTAHDNIERSIKQNTD